ncbi:MAG: hypothetical protein ACLQMO_04375 [Acidobacteriaceae bacterium]
MKPLSGWLKKPSLPVDPRPERRPAHGFAAYHWAGSSPKQDEIRDISSTGVYLLTEERWLTGTLVSLTLQRKGPLEKNSEHRVTLQAKAIRWGEDGVGLSFVLPKDLDSSLWESLVESAEDQTELVLGKFRMAEALAFLSRICPPEAEEVRQLVRGGLTNYRVASAVEIALKAETLLASVPDADRMRAHPRLVMRIVEDGSWADEDSIMQLWAGLLATSCTEDGNDESNLIFVDLFSQLASTHVRIFTAACTSATKIVSETGILSSRPLICTIEDIMRITGSRHLRRIERDLQQLSDIGLFEDNVKSPSFLTMEEANITPTSLGLQLYARCNGYRGTPQGFYGVVPSNGRGTHP